MFIPISIGLTLSTEPHSMNGWCCFLCFFYSEFMLETTRYLLQISFAQVKVFDYDFLSSFSKTSHFYLAIWYALLGLGKSVIQCVEPKKKWHFKKEISIIIYLGIRCVFVCFQKCLLIFESNRSVWFWFWFLVKNKWHLSLFHLI